MKITELSIEGCLKISSIRDDMEDFKVFKSYDERLYEDILVSTQEEGNLTLINPKRIRHEYVLTDFRNGRFELFTSSQHVSVIQILNFPKISDVMIVSEKDPSKTMYLDLYENDQLLISNNARVVIDLELENDPILVVKTSGKIDFEKKVVE